MTPWAATESTLTHVVFIFRHGGHSILVRCKLNIGLTRGLPIGRHIDVHTNRVQWREELHVNTQTIK